MIKKEERGGREGRREGERGRWCVEFRSHMLPAYFLSSGSRPGYRIEFLMSTVNAEAFIRASLFLRAKDD